MHPTKAIPKISIESLRAGTDLEISRVEAGSRVLILARLADGSLGLVQCQRDRFNHLERVLGCFRLRPNQVQLLEDALRKASAALAADAFRGES